MPNQITPQDRADFRRLAVALPMFVIIAAAVLMTVAGYLEGLPV